MTSLSPIRTWNGRASARLVKVLLPALLVGLFAGPALAWGPHPKITQAALQVLPEMERWNAALGADNVAALANYCWLPDQRGEDLGKFYADDYLLIRQMPRHVGHTMPAVQEAFVPYFRRALQALRTETPVNACRQLGPLVHFVEDAGAPPHAKPNCPHHSELENWVVAEKIVIAGYQPKRLGQTDDEAEAGLLRRIAGLVEFSAARAERALPLVSQAAPDRAQVEPIILESALESARATADLLYTVFTLGLKPQGEDTRLVGKITAGLFPSRNDHGARIVLLDSDYATLAVTDGSQPAGRWQGDYLFHHLTPGAYRVLAYRTASQFRISEPIRLKVGQETRLDIALPETDPAGNIVENPDGRLSYLLPDVPDRWRRVSSQGKPSLWLSAVATVKPQTAYRCGAVLKDPEAKVSFRFESRPGKDPKRYPPVVCPLKFEGKLQGEVTCSPDAEHTRLVVQVHSVRPLSEAIEKVWAVPEVKAPPAR